MRRHIIRADGIPQILPLSRALVEAPNVEIGRFRDASTVNQVELLELVAKHGRQCAAEIVKRPRWKTISKRGFVVLHVPQRERYDVWFHVGIEYLRRRKNRWRVKQIPAPGVRVCFVIEWANTTRAKEKAKRRARR